MTDLNRIGVIKTWLMTDHGSVLQKDFAPDMEFLLNYIEEMELPISTGRREIENLKGNISTLEYLLERANSHADEIILANIALREKYEPEEEYIPDDEDNYEYEIDYDQLVDTLIRRLK